LNWSGLDFPRERFANVMQIDATSWGRELAAHDALFAKLGSKQPAALAAERQKLAERLAV
jgi:phosphoenolpyruvate carboxykinase (GTP)